MYTRKIQENETNKPLNKIIFNEQKLFEDKLQFDEQDIDNNYNLYKSLYNIYPKENAINKINKKNSIKEEEDDYNIITYNISLAKDKTFLSDIINNNELINKSLEFTERNHISEKKNFGTNSVKFNENKNTNTNDDINFLIGNIQLFIKMNKERKKNYMIDLQYNDYPYNSIDNGSTKIKHRKISRFSKEYKNNLKLNENSTIPVCHSRFASQQINTPYLRKNRVSKNSNYSINLNDDNNYYSNNNSNNILFNYFLQYNTNDRIINQNINRVLDLNNLYEDNKLNGNSLINLKYNNLFKTDNTKRKTTYVNDDIISNRGRFEEKYAFDSSGNQKFLCVKRFDNNNDIIINNNDNINSLMVTNKNIDMNKKNVNGNLKEIVINNINMNYQNKNFKRSRSKNNNFMKTMERFVFYSPQISYKNIFSPNSKHCLSKLYKKMSGKIKNGNQQYTSLINQKDNNNIKINLNNNLKNSKSCIFKYWQNKPNRLNNKNTKNNYNTNNSNSYNFKFLNSFNKVINCENNLNETNISNNKGDIGINGGDIHTIINNSRNYHSQMVTKTESAKKNIIGFNSLNNNNALIKENNNMYNNITNRYELLNLSSKENNKIYFPFQNYANVKVDYSNKNNYKYHEINSSKEKTNKKINSTNYKNLKYISDKQKILNSTSADNIHKKYNNLYKVKLKDGTGDKNGKKIYIDNIKKKRINHGAEVEKNN